MPHTPPEPDEPEGLPDPQLPGEEDPDFDPGQGEDGEDDDADAGEQGAEQDAEAGGEAVTRKAEPDPDAELKYSGDKLPSLAELREAMDWAFAEEQVDSGVLDSYAEHARMVLEGNQRMNLTAIRDPREVAAKHYLDSWRLLGHLPLMGVSLFGASVLDLGTGAGFPGIPLALAEPQASFTLLDSTRKRVDFCQECVEALGLRNVTTVWERAEDWLSRNKVDVIIMRAVSSVRENVRTLRKVRHSHKSLVMIKGKSWSREVRAGEREAERLGFRMATYAEHDWPGELGKSCILVYESPGGRGV